MIIDAHGHYTTPPKSLEDYRRDQLARPDHAVPPPAISDDEIRASLLPMQLRLQRERRIDLTLFSPRASAMGHHLGTEVTAQRWAETCNDLIHRVCGLFPDRFVGVCQLPQTPGISPKNCIDELERCVLELGFVGCNLNPDPSGGFWTDPPLTDRYWYPIYEKLVELDVPAMIHVSASANPSFHATGAHYLNADTTVFMQCLQAPQLFSDFPSLRFVIPHGGGAVPYHWGRYRGLALDMGNGDLTELLLRNIWFDTCIYHQPGIDLLFDVLPTQNILFASEMVGAVRGRDPLTGQYFDDTKRYVDAVMSLSASQRVQVFEGNVRTVYPRLNATAGPASGGGRA